MPDPVQRVDHRIAREDDAFRRRATRQQRLPGADGGSKAQIGDGIGQHAVHFLGKGIPAIPGAQASLHMRHTDPGMVSGNGRRQHRGGIPLHQHPIRAELIEHRLDRRQQPRGHL